MKCFHGFKPAGIYSSVLILVLLKDRLPSHTSVMKSQPNLKFNNLSYTENGFRLCYHTRRGKGRRLWNVINRGQQYSKHATDVC